MSTKLETFKKHRTTINGIQIDVYYDEEPEGIVLHEKMKPHSRERMFLSAEQERKVIREISGRFG